MIGFVTIGHFYLRMYNSDSGYGRIWLVILWILKIFHFA